MHITSSKLARLNSSIIAQGDRLLEDSLNGTRGEDMARRRPLCVRAGKGDDQGPLRAHQEERRILLVHLNCIVSQDT